VVRLLFLLVSLAIYFLLLYLASPPPFDIKKRSRKK
jgi:hypothetical protein